MKEWMCRVLLVLGVVGIIFLGWLLTSVLSFWWSYYIVIIINFVVSCYLTLQSKYKV